MRFHVYLSTLLSLLLAHQFSTCAGLGWQRSQDPDPTGHAEKAVDEGKQAAYDASAESHTVLQTLKEKVTGSFESAKVSGEDAMKQAQEQGKYMGDEATRRVQEARDNAAGALHEGSERVNEAKNAAGTKAHGMYETIKETVTGPFHAAKSGGDATLKQAGEAKDSAARRLEEGAHEGSAKAHGVYETIKEKVTAPFHAAKSAGDATLKQAEEAKDEATRRATEAKDSAARRLDEGAHEGSAKVHGMYETIKEKVTGPFHAAKESTEAGVEQGKQGTRGLYHAAQEKVNEAVDKATEAYDSAAKQSSETLEEAKARVGEAADAALKATGLRKDAKDKEAEELEHERQTFIEGAMRKLEESWGKSREAGEAAGQGAHEAKKGVQTKIAETVESASEKIKQVGGWFVVWWTPLSENRMRCSTRRVGTVYRRVTLGGMRCQLSQSHKFDLIIWRLEELICAVYCGQSLGGGKGEL
jgi:hypothetical protein